MPLSGQMKLILGNIQPVRIEFSMGGKSSSVGFLRFVKPERRLLQVELRLARSEDAQRKKMQYRADEFHALASGDSRMATPRNMPIIAANTSFSFKSDGAAFQ